MDLDELLWAGADAQARALRDGTVTAPDLLEAVLRRAEEVNPRVNAFRVVYAEAARAAAAEAQRRLDAGERTPLLGVPVAMKDDLDVAGDVTTGGGLPQLPPASADSEVAARLKAAGAVLVGKTLLPDRGLWPFTETLTYGATRNPWDLGRSTGGSSGGSGAAVAAGIVGAATGSDGGGSVRIPAAACGIFGLKTSRGLVPSEPLAERWHGLTVVGPLGRRVADAAAMLEVLTGESGYLSAVETDPGPLRIALSWRTPLGNPVIEKQRKRAVLETADRLRALGHQVDVTNPALGVAPASQFFVRYHRAITDDVAALPHPEWLEARTRGMARLGSRFSDRVLARTRAAEAKLQETMGEFFGRYDVILQPALVLRQSRVGRYDGRGALQTLAGASMEIPYFPTWNVLGLPVAAVPVGFDAGGLPLGVQLVGPALSERRLLSLSGQVERAHPWADRRPTV